MTPKERKRWKSMQTGAAMLRAQTSALVTKYWSDSRSRKGVHTIQTWATWDSRQERNHDYSPEYRTHCHQKCIFLQEATFQRTSAGTELRWTASGTEETEEVESEGEAVEGDSDSPPVLRRSARTRSAPEHLKDYVTWIIFGSWTFEELCDFQQYLDWQFKKAMCGVFIWMFFEWHFSHLIFMRKGEMKCLCIALRTCALGMQG